MTLLVAAASGVAACAESPPPGEESADISAKTATDCVAAGSLRTELSIGIRASLDWGPAEMSCEGMRRPADAGARLRFSGPYENGEEKKTLTLILGIPALEEAQIGAEFPTSVTERYAEPTDSPNADSNHHDQWPRERIPPWFRFLIRR